MLYYLKHSITFLWAAHREYYVLATVEQNTSKRKCPIATVWIPPTSSEHKPASSGETLRALAEDIGTLHIQHEILPKKWMVVGVFNAHSGHLPKENPDGQEEFIK